VTRLHLYSWGMALPVHVPVLVTEVLEALAPHTGETYLDCTAGLGGHATEVAARLGPGGRLFLNDVDAANLSEAERRVREQLGTSGPAITAFRGNFADAPRQLEAAGAAADLLLADLGFSSNQMDAAERGFAFSRDGPLDMRLDATNPVTAAELVMTLPERELARLIRDFGEDFNASRIARKLVESRQEGPISTTGQLAEIVRSASGRRSGGIDSATRTFQALRIAVNDELGSLSSLLESIRRGAERRGNSWLKPGARIAIISFHSLEDRLVKQAFASLVEQGLAERLSRKPVTASDDEVSRNPRSRSAKLRAVRIAA
jgi:16S rRNA (cytosine1402-N4)-methyltransferase